MRDDRTLSERIATDLSAVRWPDPAEIRARARQRTRRSLLAVPAAVVLTVVAVWAGAGALGGAAQPLPPAATAESTPTPSDAADPSVTPTGTVTHRSADLDDIIQLDALLQPEDLGPNYEPTTSQYRYDPGEMTTWRFGFAECPGYLQLKLTTWRGYLYQVGHDYTREEPGYGTKGTGMQAERYPGRDATQLVADVHRVVAACPEYTVRESQPSSMRGYVDTRITHEILDTGFAGDSSVLVQSVSVPVLRSTGQVYGDAHVTLIAVVQVSDLVGMVFTDDFSPSEMTALAQRAVPRLCTAAKPRC